MKTNILLIIAILIPSGFIYSEFSKPLTIDQKANVYLTEMQKCNTQHCEQYYINALGELSKQLGEQDNIFVHAGWSN